MSKTSFLEYYNIPIEIIRDTSVPSKIDHTVKVVTKIAILTVGVTFNQLLNTLIFIIASTSVIDLLTILQIKHFLSIYNIIKEFTLSIDLLIHIKKDPDQEKYYSNAIPRRSNSLLLLESETLNYINLNRIFFVILCLFLVVKDPLIKMIKIEKYKIWKSIEQFANNFMYIYITNNFFTTLFRRCVLYKYIDCGFEPIKYLIIDLFCFSFIAYKVYYFFAFHFIEYKILKTSIKEIKINKSFDLRILAVFRSLVLFCRNLLLVIFLVFLEHSKFINKILCSSIVIISVSY